MSTPTRAFALLQIAKGYQIFDKSKAVLLLDRALHASLELQASDYQEGRWNHQVIRDILDEVRQLDPHHYELLLPHTTAFARAVILEQLIETSIRDNNIQRALDLYRSVMVDQSVTEVFPYYLTEKVMSSLPPEMTVQKAALFSEALGAYRESESGFIDPDEFPELVARFGREVPSDAALQAIDEVLKQAQASPDNKSSVLAGEHDSEKTFASLYDYQLFRFLPLLQLLDPQKAERLIGENPSLQQTLGQSASSKHTPNPHPVRGGQTAETGLSVYRVSSNASDLADASAHYRVTRENERIMSECAQNPKQALSDALNVTSKLGDDRMSPRVNILLQVAQQTVTVSPSIAKIAIDAIVKETEGLDTLAVKVRYLSKAGDFYLKLHDTDSALKVIDRGLKIAEDLYKHDESKLTNVPRSDWGSTATWASFIALAAQISPRTALHVTDDIPDSEIQVLERIFVADTLIGVPASSYRPDWPDYAGMRIDIPTS